MTPALVLSKNIFYRNRESEHIFNLEDCVRIIISWSEWRDSNSRHPAPKAGALPTALHPEMVPLKNFGYYTPGKGKKQPKVGLLF